MLMELAKREKAAGITPESDVDVYMKVPQLLSFTNHQHMGLHLYKSYAPSRLNLFHIIQNSRVFFPAVNTQMCM